jgi:hypothetical protein
LTGRDFLSQCWLLQLSGRCSSAARLSGSALGAPCAWRWGSHPGHCSGLATVTNFGAGWLAGKGCAIKAGTVYTERRPHAAAVFFVPFPSYAMCPMTEIAHMLPVSALAGQVERAVCRPAYVSSVPSEESVAQAVYVAGSRTSTVIRFHWPHWFGLRCVSLSQLTTIVQTP